MKYESILHSVFSQNCDNTMSLFTGLDCPVITEKSIKTYREKCSENICGLYGNCWSCPPHVCTVEECLDSVKTYKNSAVIAMVIDAEKTDKESVRNDSEKLQNICRKLTHALRNENVKVQPLTGGQCLYCKKCSFEEKIPCRFPEEMVPSASGYGVDIFKLIKDNDIPADDGIFRLYGLILY